MVTISKVLPKEFDPEKSYGVRVRSVNAFGNVSLWSNSIFVDPSLISPSQSKIIETDSYLSIYDDDGQMIFGAFTEEDYRTNYVTNPSFETNLNTWSILTGGTGTRINTSSLFGLNCVKIVPTTDTKLLLGIKHSTSGYINVLPEEVYSVSAHVYRSFRTASHDEFAQSEFSNFDILISLYDGANNLLAVANTDNFTQVPNNEWVRIKGRNLVIPTRVSKMGITIQYSKENVEVVNSKYEYILIDGVMAETGPDIGSYFDGDSIMDITGWDGTPHASTSHFDNLEDI